MATIQARLVRLLVKYRISKILQADIPVKDQRKRLEQLSVLSFASPLTKIKDVFIGDVSAEWVTHRRAKTNQAILYLHGGGYAVGSSGASRLLAERLSAKSEAVVLVPNYRLAPEHPFPAALEDAINAYDWLLERGFAPDKIAIAGDSAGGGLTLATVLKLKQTRRLMPSSLVVFSPWVDLTLSGESMTNNRKKELMLNPQWMTLMARYYASGAPDDTPLCSPLFADLSHLPPAMIQVSRQEILYDDSRRLAERYQQAGNHVVLDEWTGMWHVWQLFVRYLPEANQAVARAGKFIRQQWSDKYPDIARQN
ncbi:MAG: alpha/beta hydrolase [Proteobacteria bacterium]|nr:MAG: alpha/beta hydrolase [Pseudomonadota bacterium]